MPSDCAPSDTTIVKAAIYPPIGVCRVGNSPTEYYLGPEVDNPDPQEPGAYRDAQGRLKREAARFRVYGLNAAGQAVAELTAETAQIKWMVALANQKSSWYQFQLAMDIPEFDDAPVQLRRNDDVPDRARLTISPTPLAIAGPNQSGAGYSFDDGAFMGTSVYLGELMTDDAGRLIVLGGHGVSASYDGREAVTFANNETWHDDTSDGPVTARVVLDGQELEVDPAWVICAPPNYGPQQKSVRTMWDLMRDVAVTAGTLDRPVRPSFQNDIRPIFKRMTDLQWVNKGFAAGFGFGAPFDFASPEWLAKLNDNSEGMKETRRILSNNFRRFDRENNSAVPWPWLYGDAMNVPPADTPRQHAALSDLQLSMLDQWVEGDFDADYDPDAVFPQSVEDLPVQDQPAMLTKAAMDFCLADAFHPGCEMTWPMRQAKMYSAPFRLKHRPAGEQEPNYGAQLGTSEIGMTAGPIQGGQSPGSITRWMAIPWQTDTASCRAGYWRKYDPHLPTFWPARVPNEVLSSENYAVVMDTNAPMESRLAAFAARASWLEPLDPAGPKTHQLNHMVDHFDQMGVVQVHPGPTDTDAFPAVMQVSDQQPMAAGTLMADIGDAADHTDFSDDPKLNRYPRLRS